MNKTTNIQIKNKNNKKLFIASVAILVALALVESYNGCRRCPSQSQKVRK